MNRLINIRVILVFAFIYLVSFLFVREVNAQCGITVACADPGPPGGSAIIIILPPDTPSPDPLRLGQVYIESDGKKYGIEGATIRVSGVCNIGLPPSCDGDYYQVQGTTHKDGNYYDTDFAWPAGSGVAMGNGWIKPDVRLVTLPSSVAILGLSNFVAVNCNKGGDEILNNGWFCHDPENVCPASMDYYNDCNLSGRGFDIGAFDFKFQAPPTVDIKVNNSNGPITVNYNTAATLSWSSTNAVGCTASGSWSGVKAVSGSASTGSLTNSSYTYNLRCCSATSCATDSVTVNVLGAGTLSVVKKEISNQSTDCSNPAGWVAPLSSVTLQANISQSIGIRTLTYTNSTLSVPAAGTGYWVSAQNPSSSYASASNVVYCSRVGSTGAFTRTTSPPTVMVRPGQTTTVYIGFLRLGALNVQARALTALPSTCAQVVGGSAIAGVRASITGYAAQNLNYVFSNLIPGNFIVTGAAAPAGYSGYYMCIDSNGAPTVGSRSVTVASGAQANMYVGVVANPTLSGTIFDASERDNCSIKTPAISGATVTWGSYSRITDVNGNYSMAVAPGTNTLNVVAPGYNGLKLSCDVGTLPQTLTMSAGVSQTRSFGFWGNLSGWFQATGDVYGGGGITETIPGSCVAPCQPYLIKADAYGTGLARVWAGKSITLGTGVLASLLNYQAVSGPPVGTKIYNYDYYKVKMSRFPQTVWNGSGKPTYTNPDNQGFEVYKKSGATIIDFGVTATEKMVFLIDGDVTINTDNTTVPTGGYLAIIANGTITFTSDVTSAQGVFVADSISIPSNGSGLHDDLLFTGSGSFIGYNSIVMSRDRGSINNTAPAETFIFRPDLVINSPLPMMTKDSTWREVVPD
jgi:hypothetical protein